MMEKKTLRRAVAIVLAAAAVLQMLSVAFAKPGNKK